MTIGLGILVTGGFLAGLLFWQAFNTGMEYTNSEQFCVSCHTMSHNEAELQETVHWKNRTGVRAYCADCHVPHNFTDKIARKMQASRMYHIIVQIKLLVKCRQDVKCCLTSWVILIRKKNLKRNV
ncbi:NapC/NirT family cytochrome c [Wohlfahrtiimonas populi]